ncbi:MAG: ATP-grasp domain-containing protein [Spirochaetales bacterium]|nr:ATP-grasp domain-containing protein [Spirochaetales bacterium]
MRARRLLVLGGGSSQLSLLARCRDHGFFTVLADRDPRAPGRALADAFEPASTFDAEAVLRAARRQRVHAILTAGTDQPVLVAARVASALGLPSFLDVPTALAVTNKRVMKARLRELNLPTARWALVDRRVDPGGLAALRPPFVTKPVDSQGQRGVYLLPDARAVHNVADDVLSFSREEQFLVEEYYPSREVTVSGWVGQGRPVLLTVTDRVTVEARPHIGVCFAHRYPTHLADRMAEIAVLTQRVVEGFGIREGPLYFQFLVGAQGVVVNELSCRLGGAYEDRFIPRVTGIDPLELLIRGSLGESVAAVPDRGFDEAAAPSCVSVALLFCRPGRIAELSDLTALRGMPGVIAVEWLQGPGTVIGPLVNSAQRVGYLVVEARGAQEINARLDAALGAMHVSGEDGEELLLDARAQAWHPGRR